MRARHRFDDQRASLRPWLYAIATNICIDLLRGAQRRAQAMDLGPAAGVGPELGSPLPEATWILPVPDAAVLPTYGDPAELATLRESVRLAFVAALQHLPPRQRAVLILRDVLRWRADEVAALLETTVASVTSALQRARATLASRPRLDSRLDPDHADLLDRYCAAFEAYDIDVMVSMLRDDVIMSMPPYLWWLQGRSTVDVAMRAAGNPCAGTRVLPVAANGTTALAQYLPGVDGRLRPFALTVLEFVGGRIATTSTFLDAVRLFPVFHLTDEFAGSASYHQV